MSFINHTININCLINSNSNAESYTAEYLKQDFSAFRFKKIDGTHIDVKADWHICTSKALNASRFHVIVNSELKEKDNNRFLSSEQHILEPHVSMFLRVDAKEVMATEEISEEEENDPFNQKWPSGVMTFWIDFRLNNLKTDLENVEPLSKKNIKSGQLNRKCMLQMAQLAFKQQHPEIYSSLKIAKQNSSTPELKKTDQKQHETEMPSATKSKWWNIFINALFRKSAVLARFKKTIITVTAVAISTILATAYLNRTK